LKAERKITGKYAMKKEIQIAKMEKEKGEIKEGF
jgi:hypothetical protein